MEVSMNLSNASDVIDSKWDDAIRIATDELRQIEVQKKRLQQAIRTFQLNKKERVPWPEAYDKNDVISV